MLEQRSIEPFLDASLVQAIAHLMVAEGKTESLWRLLTLQDAPVFSTAAAMDPSKDRQGQRSILENLLESQAFWSDRRRRFTKPLETFLRVSRLKKNPKQRKLGFSIYPTTRWLTKVLTRYGDLGLKVNLYDAVLEHTRGVMHDAEDILFDCSMLELMHPHNPRPHSMLELCKAQQNTQHSPTKLEMLLRSEVVNQAHSGFLTLIRLAQACEAHGLHADARWLLDWGYEFAPHMYLPRAPGQRKPHMKDIHNIPLRRKATEKELKDGVPVDEHGYMVRSPEMLEWYKDSRV